MKSFLKKAGVVLSILACLLAVFLPQALAAGTADIDTSNVQSIVSGNLADAVASYKQANPSAAQHTVTARHRIVYDTEAYFIDSVNATGSYYSCYAKIGADLLYNKYSQLGINMQVVTDNTAAAANEIMVGKVDRAVQDSYFPLIDANEYAIVVTEAHIMLLAFEDVGLKACVKSLLDYLSTTTLSLPVGFVGIGVTSSTWQVDFPRPTATNVSLSSAQYVNDDSLQFYYTGTGVTRSAFRTYCTKLVADGFSLVWQNSIGNNEFRMYKHTGKGIALYAAYNDHTYASKYDALYEQHYGTEDSHVDCKFEKCIRLISSPLSSITLPEESVTQKSYTKVTDTYLTTLSFASAQVGTGYVLMLEDGRFIVIDGGAVSAAQNGVRPESKAIWDTMVALYKKAYGSSATPTAQRPLHVAAWYLTHAHSDHYYAFQYFASMVGADSSKKSVFKMDYVIANLPGDGSLFENTSVRWGYENSANIHAMKSSLGNFELIKVHAGQKLYLANLEIEVLMTYEDHLPHRIINTNDTNTVTRFYIRSSGAAKNSTVTSLTGNATTIMFLGDSWRPTSRHLCAMYGDYLKSDISQIAHHGNIGCEQELYQAIAPTAVLFPHEVGAFRNYLWGSNTSTNPEREHAFTVDKYLLRGQTMNGHTLTSVKYIWCAPVGKYTTLQFTKAGAHYKTAFDLLTGRTITYVNVTQSSSSQNGFVCCFTTCPGHIGATNCTSSYTCTLCGASAAAIGHDFSGAWKSDTQGHWHVCQRAGCGATDSKISHTPRADDGDCTTAVTCSVCNGVAVPAKAHTGGTATCQSRAECTTCGKTYGAVASHKPYADDGDCTTAKICSVCDTVLTEGASAHSGGVATCLSKARCTICGTAYGELAAHVDRNANNECDVCLQPIVAEEPEPTPDQPDTPTEPDTPDTPAQPNAPEAPADPGVTDPALAETPGYVIALIALGAAALLAGGICLYLFVFKRRK